MTDDEAAGGKTSGDGQQPDQEALRRQARRAFVRKAHPDVGGDPEVFRLGLAAIDGEPTADTTPELPVTERLRAAAAGRAAKLARDWVRVPREVRQAYRSGRGEPDGPSSSDGRPPA
jgi:hypothetical protein